MSPVWWMGQQPVVCPRDRMPCSSEEEHVTDGPPAR